MSVPICDRSEWSGPVARSPKAEPCRYRAGGQKKKQYIHGKKKKNANANQNDIRSKAGFFHLLSMPEKVGSLIQRVGFSSPRSSNAFGRPGSCLRMLLMATWTLASIFGGSFAISSGLRWISVS